MEQHRKAPALALATAAQTTAPENKDYLVVLLGSSWCCGPPTPPPKYSGREVFRAPACQQSASPAAVRGTNVVNVDTSVIDTAQAGGAKENSRVHMDHSVVHTLAVGGKSCICGPESVQNSKRPRCLNQKREKRVYRGLT